jgi:hypothetical protein
MNFTRNLLWALVTAVIMCGARADTVVMKTLEVIEGKIVKTNPEFIELQVEYGTMRVPREKILRIDPDTPEIIAEREARATKLKEETEKNLAAGKIQYKGKWVKPEEKEADEKRIADAKKKRDEERAAAKKKAEEEAAALKKQQDAELAQELAREAQQAQQDQQLHKQRDRDYRNSRYKDAINQFNGGNLSNTLKNNGF